MGYVMQALESYDAATVGAFPNFAFQDKQYIGASVDYVRRKIMYTMKAYNGSLDANNNLLVANPAGVVLWSGLSAIPSAAKIEFINDVIDGADFFVFVMEKDLDTGAVVKYPCYLAANKVPSGIGAGGISTYTTAHSAIGTNVTNALVSLTGGSGSGADALITVAGGAITVGPVLNYIGQGYTVTNVLTGIVAGTHFTITVTAINTGSDGTWERFVTDAAHATPPSDQVLIVDPYTSNVWVRMQSCEVYLFRHSDSFSQVISPWIPALNALNTQEPLGVTASWSYIWEFDSGSSGSVLHVLPSTITAGEITADKLLSSHDYTYPTLLETYNFRHCLGADGNVYVFAGSTTGARAFKLYSVVVGTGFSDITPWSGSNGPNTSVASYTNGNSGPTNLVFSKNYVLQLHATNQLALISKLFTNETSDDSPTRVDCTYYDIAGATFDYHQGFVTEWMAYDGVNASSFVPTTELASFYQVIDFRELNNFLNQSDHDYGVDYTTRWFMFIVVQQAPGTSNNNFCVFVEYKFTYGAAPVPLQVIPETGWDNVYSGSYAPNGQVEVVAVSLPTLPTSQTQGAGTNAVLTDSYQQDSGFFDYATGDFWLSGDQPVFTSFNGAFSARQTPAAEFFSSGAPTAGASSPFMRLSISQTSQGQIF